MKLQFLEITEHSLPDLLDMMASFYAIDHYPFDRAKHKIIKTNGYFLGLMTNQNAQIG